MEAKLLRELGSIKIEQLKHFLIFHDYKNIENTLIYKIRPFYLNFYSNCGTLYILYG